MEAKRKFVTCGFSILFFFTWGAANQTTHHAHAGFFADFRPSAFAGIRADGINRPKRSRRSATSDGWLEGVWEGTAYQSNNKENWTLRLTAKNNTYRVEYPSLSCGGEWKPLRRSRRIATFREKLTYGQNDCVDNVTVTIQKLSDTQIIYWYVEPNQTRVMGIAVLDRQ